MSDLSRYVTTKQLRQQLGVTETTIRRWRNQAGFPYLKLGTGRKAPLRFDPVAVELWLQRWNRTSCEEVKAPEPEPEPGFMFV